MTELLQKYWNMDYLTEKHLAGFDSYKVSRVSFLSHSNQIRRLV